jgi:hypothetical protein
VLFFGPSVLASEKQSRSERSRAETFIPKTWDIKIFQSEHLLAGCAGAQHCPFNKIRTAACSRPAEVPASINWARLPAAHRSPTCPGGVQHKPHAETTHRALLRSSRLGTRAAIRSGLLFEANSSFIDISGRAPKRCKQLAIFLNVRYQA